MIFHFAHSWSGNVFSVQSPVGSQLWIKVKTGPWVGNWVKTLWALGFGIETKQWTWAWGPPTTDSTSFNGAPGDFNSAMDQQDAGYSEYFLVSCLTQKEKVCRFRLPTGVTMPPTDAPA